ncbi:makorin-2 [Coprinopsis cinerea okayama7|uniref:Makorin-2 n=1 Tax=Coprinopsis cinerea (strain Okayama-7 / 130 / ATCC MYA-4618 / FGSC 9003) TaxID=240176 RepID=A8NA24_COPC7|nr:makorin-2 [Coprinopsis cinerea okayama7\|eukprot:XP_001831680.2 makorin-2 [Coprinopsis cinerea okayama7\
MDQQAKDQNRAKTCRYFANGFCKRGDNCWFKHVLGPSDKSKGKGKERESADADSDGEQYLCSICFETPVTFGLLAGCNHVFCITCIKQWRDPAAKSVDVVTSGNTKKCPMCRTPSHFITPCSTFINHGAPEKELVVQNYKDSMSRVPCKYFQQSKSKPERMCPFGKDCFYKHENDDGTPYVFTEGADVWLRKWARRNSPRRPRLFDFDDDDDGEGFAEFFPFSLSLNSIPLFDLIPSMMTGRPQPRIVPFGAARGNPSRAPGGGIADRPPEDVEVTLGGMDANNRNDDTVSLQDLERTVDALGDAFQRSTSLAQLAAELRALRDQAARLVASNGLTANPSTNDANPTPGAQGEGNRRRNRVAETETEAVERLGILAEQMLTSVNVLRTGLVPGTVTTGEDRAGTPPPLEAVEDDASADEDMPDLQEVSSSSDDDAYSDISSGEDYESESDGDDIIRELLRDVIGEGGLGNRSSRLTDEEGENRTSRGLPMLGIVGRSNSANENDNDSMPDLEPITSDSEDDDAHSPPRRTSERSRDVGESTSTASPASGPISQEPSLPSVVPPFVTDGRGRVVWTSESSQNVPEQRRRGGASTRAPPGVTDNSPSPQTNTTSNQDATTSVTVPPTTPSLATEASSQSGKTIQPGVNPSEARIATAGGFTTDGRGRVIGTAETRSGQAGPSDAPEGQSQDVVDQHARVASAVPASPSSHSSVLGRMINAFFGS